MKNMIGDALNIVMQKFKEEFGDDAKLEEDDEIVTCFANGVLIISVVDKEVKIKVIGGKAYQSDYEIPIFNCEAKEDNQ